MQEAKYDIYRDYLGYNDFSNFDGVILAYKGVKLKELINVDGLVGWKNFDYKRKMKRVEKLLN